VRIAFPLLVLTACAAPTVCEKVVVVEFERGVILRMEMHSEFELHVASTPAGCEDWRNESLLDRVAELSDERIADEVRLGIACPYQRPPRDDAWKQAITDVSITRLDDRPALRVETRSGDFESMARVVAWLEACGGKRVR